MPDIVPTAPLPVNGPPVPGALAPIQGPPLPSNLAPVQGPPAPVQAADVTPPVLGKTSQNPPAIPTPVMDADPMAVSKAAINDAQAAQTDEQKAAKAEADAQQKKAEADAALADKQAEAIRKQQADTDAQQQASEQARGRLVALAQQADNDVGNFRFHDFKDTIPTSRKAWLILGAALSGLTGDRDPVAQINTLTAQHFEKEKAELSSKENLAKYRRSGIEDFDRHVSDQRMLLEMKERNYREAMAKETEAQGLRSGSPVAAAKAQQIAAKIRADGDAKLSGMVEQYTKGEEARARAAQLKAKARGAGAARGGKDDAESKLADAAQNGEPYANLVRLALKLGVKDPRKAATEALTGVEKDQQSIFTDPSTGKQYRVPSGRGGTGKIADEFAANESYVNAVEAFAKHIEENGRILNKWSDEGKMRESLAADVQSKGRQVQGIQASDAGAKLEHMVIGGTGTGVGTMASPEVLRRLAKEAADKTATKLRASLTPLPGRGTRDMQGEPSAGAAPRVPSDVIEKAKAEVKSNGPHAASARKLLDQQGITVL